MRAIYCLDKQIHVCDRKSRREASMWLSLVFSHLCLNGAVLFCRFQSVVCFALLSCCVTELETKWSICHV